MWRKNSVSSVYPTTTEDFEMPSSSSSKLLERTLAELATQRTEIGLPGQAESTESFRRHRRRRPAPPLIDKDENNDNDNDSNSNNNNTNEHDDEDEDRNDDGNDTQEHLLTVEMKRRLYSRGLSEFSNSPNSVLTTSLGVYKEALLQLTSAASFSDDSSYNREQQRRRRRQGRREQEEQDKQQEVSRRQSDFGLRPASLPMFNSSSRSSSSSSSKTPPPLRLESLQTIRPVPATRPGAMAMGGRKSTGRFDSTDTYDPTQPLGEEEGNNDNEYTARMERTKLRDINTPTILNASLVQSEVITNTNPTIHEGQEEPSVVIYQAENVVSMESLKRRRRRCVRCVVIFVVVHIFLVSFIPPTIIIIKRRKKLRLATSPSRLPPQPLPAATTTFP